MRSIPGHEYGFVPEHVPGMYEEILPENSQRTEDQDAGTFSICFRGE
jgi:hypothetical protein